MIKIGGSLLFTKEKIINKEIITEFCKIFLESPDYDQLVIVSGGGIIARDYIKAVRAFTENEALCDTFGIEISRINSKLIAAAFMDKAYPLIPKSMEELSTALLSKKIIVIGGLQPGQSTTSVALEVSEFIRADQLIILTDVDGIYDNDPKKFKDAKLLKQLNYAQLQDLILNLKGDKQAAAGEYRIFDAVSLQILKRSKLKILLMSGKKLDQFKKFWNGEKEIIGTFITN